MKKFGVFIVALIGVIISAFTFQYGWNAIITTIIPVNEISIWQAFGCLLYTSPSPRDA